MKKNLGNSPVVAPLPVLIVATYDEHGTPNAMNVAWGGQCGYHHVALNLSLNHKTTENLKHTEALPPLIRWFYPIISDLCRDERRIKSRKPEYTLLVANLSMPLSLTNIL